MLTRFLFALLLIAAPAMAQSQWREVYWSPLFNGVPLTGMPWSALTHITHVNTEIANSNDGSLHYYCYGTANCTFSQMQVDAASVISAAHTNGVKACAQIATGSGNWATVTNPTNLPNFVNNTMTVVNLGFDCLSIDWEGAANYNQTNMDAMDIALKARLGTKQLNLTIVPNNFSNGQIMANIQAHVDTFDVMTYDFSFGSPPTWFNSPLNSDPGQGYPTPGTNAGDWGSFDWNFQNLTSRGIPANKLNFGYEANGYILTGSTGPRQNVSASSSTMNYNRIVSTYPSQVTNPTRDSVAEMPWFQTSSNSWINYDDPTSIAAKVAWAKSKGVGLFQWEASGDYVNGGHPLLQALGNAWDGGGGGSTPTAPTITSTSLPAGTVGVAYGQTFAASGTTPITWSLTSGALPSGLSLTPSTGLISGTPTAPGTSTFTIQATNAVGNNSKQFTLTVNGGSGGPTPPTITTVSPLPPGTFALTQNESTQIGSSRLTMQGDGNLVLYGEGGTAMWSTGTSGQNCGTDQCFAIFQGDGNFVIYNGSVPLWGSGSSGNPSAQLVLSTQVPQLEIISANQSVLWANVPRFMAGNFALTQNESTQIGSSRLTMQGDGNLVLYGEGGTAMWSTGTSGQNCGTDQCFAIFQGDGNFVIYNGSVPLWGSGSSGNPSAQLVLSIQVPQLEIISANQSVLWANVPRFTAGTFALTQNESTQIGSSRLTMQGDGNLVLYGEGGTAMWSTGTSGQNCGTDQCFAIFQGDGNFVIYNGSVPLWGSGSSGNPSAQLVLSTQVPQLEIISANQSVLWANVPRFMAGNFALTQNESTQIGSLRLTMQGDGNLVLYGEGGTAMWSTGTSGQNCGTDQCFAIFQGDGNFVIYNGSVPLWSSGTSGNASAQFVLSNQVLQLEIISTNQSVLWSN